MVKKKYLDFYRFGKKDVELRAIKPQWKNSQPEDMAFIQCGKQILRKKRARAQRSYNLKTNS
ncbi:MAG: hypothetical protein OEW62_01180 [Candidatus Bathyarchaeota archaeon]|nr:hypothetical protein [Candidatus Bathyarchaeota archaeon]MDH5595220.1 hypothetical protein [Candidatus Bathyarchaeota archaeon]